VPELGLPAVKVPVQVAVLFVIVTVTDPVGFGCPLTPVTLKFTVTGCPVTDEVDDSEVIWTVGVAKVTVNVVLPVAGLFLFPLDVPRIV
jgi:hypothetical protein